MRTRSGWRSASSWATIPPIEMPEHVRASPAELVEQARGVLGEVGDRERLVDAALRPMPRWS